MTFRWRRLSRRKWEQQLAEEVRHHIDQQAAQNVAAGTAPEEARRRAIAQFGAVEGVKEGCREERHGFWIETILTDIRYGLRMLRKNPAFSAIAILTLALGIGASAAVFSLVNAILLKPLPFPNASRDVMIWELVPKGMNLGVDKIPWGRVESLFLAQQTKTFEALGIFKGDSLNLTGAGEPTRLNAIRASAGFFPALGVRPILGHTFTEQEDQPGGEHEAVLGYALWRDRFGSDTQIAGRVLTLNGEAYRVVGVMPSGFAFPHGEELPPDMNFPRDVQIWIPLALNRGPRIPAEPSELGIVACIRKGLAISQSRAEMALMARRLEEQTPQAKGWYESQLVPIAQQAAGDTERPLVLLLGAVGVVLLIACCNVASLLLSRSVVRRREFTIRAALGAGRRRLIRQLLTESGVLAVAGGVLGIAFAEAGIYFAKTLGPTTLPRLRDVSLDLAVAGFLVAVTFAAAIVFGLFPAIAAGRENVADSLKESGQRSGVTVQSQALRKALLISEVALAMVLVIAAGLLTRSFFHLLSVDPGFRPARILTFELSLPTAGYPDQARMIALYQNTLEKVRALPGVESAGVVDVVPMGGGSQQTAIRIPGLDLRVAKASPIANYTMISPGYLATVGISILRGRDFLATDTADSQPVSIISANLAEVFFHGEDPIGKQIGPGSPLYPAGVIVGIAANVKHFSMRDESFPEMYVPFTQKVWPSLSTMSVVLRTSSEPAPVTAAVRQAVHSVDADLPLARITTLANLVDDSMAKPRFATLLLGFFGALSLLLASLGMYGVVSYSVGQRTHEIGIRIAIGAQRAGVFAMVLNQGARLAALGISIGLLAAWGVTRLMSSFLYGVRAMDLATYVAVSIFLAGVTLLACYVPARRAMRVDPMVALRYE